LRASLETIAELHSAPSRERRIAAITAIDTAMASLVTDAAHLGIQHSTRQQLLTMLHFLHSALLDEESVLASSEN
jgi:hypothetical protein